MTAQAQYEFQWQNVALRQTIYPFREKKLMDFLLIYDEIDLWKAKKNMPVDAKIAAELSQEHTRLKNQLEQARRTRQQTLKDLDLLKQKHREALSSRTVRELTYKKLALQNKLGGLEATMNSIKGRLDWYTQFAPDHPYHAKFTRDYELSKVPYEQTLAELKAIETAYMKEIGPFEAEAKNLNQRFADAEVLIKQSTEEIARLPLLDKNGQVTQRAAVKWMILKEERELAKLDHDQLLKMVIERFEKQPQRFPKWLQYMVIHFSGMRYQSAHGSWAEPRDLLISLKLEELKEKNKTTPKPELEQQAASAAAELQKQRQATTDASKARLLDRQLAALKNPYSFQRALLDYQVEQINQQVGILAESEVLKSLKAMKAQLPDWVWREIVRRTDLRLETTDMNWETQTAADVQERWKWENYRWTSILNAWEGKDVTAWRAEHAATLTLIVTRAVCNEVAEHIQHLRGLVPGGGLTAKPDWYLKMQGALPGKAYFKRPATTNDLKTGASVLFLGYSTTQPNAWQVAKPLPGFNLTSMEGDRPAAGKPGDEEKKGKAKSTGPSQWLRWTHEATVVEPVEMADGNYVLTFETGQIGVNLRAFSQILNRWDIFVGFTPANPTPPPALESMLDPKRILLLKPAPRPGSAPGVSFGVTEEAPVLAATPEPSDEGWSTEKIVRRWRKLTRRQKQVVALFCQGFSMRQIGERLGISAGTARGHMRKAVDKFRLDSREDLAAILADWDFERFGI